MSRSYDVFQIYPSTQPVGGVNTQTFDPTNKESIAYRSGRDITLRQLVKERATWMQRMMQNRGIDGTVLLRKQTVYISDWEEVKL